MPDNDFLITTTSNLNKSVILKLEWSTLYVCQTAHTWFIQQNVNLKDAGASSNAFLPKFLTDINVWIVNKIKTPEGPFPHPSLLSSIRYPSLNLTFNNKSILLFLNIYIIQYITNLLKSFLSEYRYIYKRYKGSRKTLIIVFDCTSFKK